MPLRDFGDDELKEERGGGGVKLTLANWLMILSTLSSAGLVAVKESRPADPNLRADINTALAELRTLSNEQAGMRQQVSDMEKRIDNIDREVRDYLQQRYRQQ